jgi:hypothetical protein
MGVSPGGDERRSLAQAAELGMLSDAAPHLVCVAAHGYAKDAREAKVC